MNTQFNNKTLLLLIDLQNAIEHPSWGNRNNPNAEENTEALLNHWRENDMPIIHIKHMSSEPDSHYRPNQNGNEFRTFATPLADEEVIEKSTNNAFIRTNLEEKLHSRNIEQIVIIGVITNNSVEATARMSGNLGFHTIVIADATYTFDKTDYSGNKHKAQTIHDIALANLDGEYAQVMNTHEILN